MLRICNYEHFYCLAAWANACTCCSESYYFRLLQGIAARFVPLNVKIDDLVGVIKNLLVSNSLVFILNSVILFKLLINLLFII